MTPPAPPAAIGRRMDGRTLLLTVRAVAEAAAGRRAAHPLPLSPRLQRQLANRPAGRLVAPRRYGHLRVCSPRAGVLEVATTAWHDGAAHPYALRLERRDGRWTVVEVLHLLVGWDSASATLPGGVRQGRDACEVAA